MQRFPDHDACLDHLKDRFYPDDTACPKCVEAVEVLSDQGAIGLWMPVLRPPRLPHGRDDLSQEHDEPPTVVLGDLPNQQHPLRHLGEAARPRDRRHVQDGPPDVQADPHPPRRGHVPPALGQRSRWTRPSLAGSPERQTGVRIAEQHHPRYRDMKRKQIVFAAIERGGSVRAAGSSRPHEGHLDQARPRSSCYRRR